MRCGGGKFLRITENVQFFYGTNGIVRLTRTRSTLRAHTTILTYNAHHRTRTHAVERDAGVRAQLARGTPGGGRGLGVDLISHPSQRAPGGSQPQTRLRRPPAPGRRDPLKSAQRSLVFFLPRILSSSSVGSGFVFGAVFRHACTSLLDSPAAAASPPASTSSAPQPAATAACHIPPGQPCFPTVVVFPLTHNNPPPATLAVSASQTSSS